MKIAFIHHTFSLGSGIDTVIYELCKRLSKKHNVTVFTFYNEYGDNLNFEVKEVSIPFKKNRTVNAVLSPVFIHKLIEIRNYIEKYDVVNTHLYPANIIPLIPYKVGNPLNIVTEWSGPTGSNLNLKFTEKLYIEFSKKMNKYAAKHANAVIAPCDFVKNWIKKEYGIDAVKMFLDGINFDLFDKNKPYDSIYYKYPSLEDSPVILYVGRVAPNKNVDMLIKSFNIVKKKIVDAKLVIVGKHSFPEYSKYLRKLVKNYNLEEDVIFTGVVSWDDLPKYYAACDVYATCSAWEGFLRAEAFAMEKPMVAFDVSANSETIQHGKNGILVKEQTPEAFADALIELLLNDKLRKILGKNGYKWAKENLDFDVIVKNFENFIANKCGGNK